MKKRRNPMARVLAQKQFKAKVTKNKKRYDRKREKHVKD